MTVNNDINDDSATKHGDSIPFESLKPTANPGRRSTVMELPSATPVDSHDYSNFRTAVGKLLFMAPCRPDMQFAIQQQSTHVLNPTTESKRAVKQLIRYFKGTQQTCLRHEPRGMAQKGLLELTQIGPAIRQHAKVLRDIIAMYRT